MYPLFQDIRYAARQLLKERTVSAVLIVTIALGMGVNTAVFSMLNGILRPLPVKAPEQLVVLAAETKGDDTGIRFQFPIRRCRTTAGLRSPSATSSGSPKASKD